MEKFVKALMVLVVMLAASVAKATTPAEVLRVEPGRYQVLQIEPTDVGKVMVAEAAPCPPSAPCPPPAAGAGTPSPTGPAGPAAAPPAPSGDKSGKSCWLWGLLALLAGGVLGYLLHCRRRASAMPGVQTPATTQPSATSHVDQQEAARLKYRWLARRARRIRHEAASGPNDPLTIRAREVELRAHGRYIGFVGAVDTEQTEDVDDPNVELEPDPLDTGTRARREESDPARVPPPPR